jgi:hypothetical protein
MSDTKSEPVVLSNPKHAALALAINGHLRCVNQLPTGRLEFHFDGVPQDLEEQVINDQIKVSAKRFIDAMEAILGLIASRKRAR